MSVKQCPVKLVAMADVFAQRSNGSYQALKRQFDDEVDVPKERQFIGFDAYQKAMDCLKPGDIAIFATPLAFRWVHFGYAIEKGLNVFMEKPLIGRRPDVPQDVRAGREGDEKNLKVGVGLMSRHCLAVAATRRPDPRRRNRRPGPAPRLPHGRPGGIMSLARKPAGISEVAYQIQRFHSFLWASGGCFSDFYIHIIDHCCWMKNAWPVKAQAWAAGIIAATTSTRTSTIIPWNTLSPTARKFIMDGRCMPAAKISTTALPTARKARPWSPRRRLRSASATFKGLGSSPARTNDLAIEPQRRGRTPIATNGTTWSTPSSTTSPTTRSSGASRPAW